MLPTDSVTQWVAKLKAGEEVAAQRLWERFFTRLMDLARARMTGLPRAVVDEEDVALSALDSFCRGAAAGRFPRLDDRDDLWRLLIVIVTRKVADLAERQTREKRGGTDAHPIEVNLEKMISTEPTPEFVAVMTEECDRLMRRLGDETLREVAGWKMEGFTTVEIAGKLGCAPRTVERKLKVIRNLWDL